MQIKHLNNELLPLNFIPKEMEADGPTFAFLLANYYKKIKYWKKKDSYEVLEFEALVMATFFYPVFRLRFFAHFWPEEEQHAQLKKSQDAPKVDKNNILKIFQCSSQLFRNKRARCLCQKHGLLPGPASKDQNSHVIWWKHHLFAEKMSSSEAVVFSRGGGSLKPQKIVRCETLRRLKILSRIMSIPLKKPFFFIFYLSS
ncbi:hypothetical protein VP01_1826g2 [Puccinia sorghi]|uniref:Uncharacterized protein n=1 Tax=Puccinia sorghi TaxID=27349 RepID=A0A0L6VDV9_9BASI|nr:hypothetical protein VP01_1826g2 [Puccinia sorghi]